MGSVLAKFPVIGKHFEDEKNFDGKKTISTKAFEELASYTTCKSSNS